MIYYIIEGYINKISDSLEPDIYYLTNRYIKERCVIPCLILLMQKYNSILNH